MTTSIPSAEEASEPPKILYCLDFDGVLCDSVHETFLSGWRACKLLWNGNVKGYWMEAFETDPQKMNRLEDDFRFVRPILYVGWEAILLIRLLATKDVASASLLLDADSSISIRDAVFRGFHNEFRHRCLETWGFSVADYGDAMSRARDGWIADDEGCRSDAPEMSRGGAVKKDEGSWIDAHGFYWGACRAVKNYLHEKGNEDVYIITTKAKEFALRLLAKQELFELNDSDMDDASDTNTNTNSNTNNATIQESHIFGLGSGSKASVLQQILEARSRNSSSSSPIDYFAVMVEDNIATLDNISRSPIGDRVLPVVASWGYNTVEQLSRVLQTTTTTTTKPSRIVLPLLRNTSELCAAKNAKEGDPTGCSMASILQTPLDAGKLLVQESESGAAAGVVVEREKLYDFSSTQQTIALDYWQRRSRESICF